MDKTNVINNNNGTYDAVEENMVISNAGDKHIFGIKQMFENNQVLIHTDSQPMESFQIHIGSKDNPCPSVNDEKYTLVLNGEPQTKRQGDTLTILDSSIQFVVIDGVKYEKGNILNLTSAGKGG